MTLFNVFKMRKLKSFTELYKSICHNTRQIITANIDFDRIKLNKNYFADENLKNLKDLKIENGELNSVKKIYENFIFRGLNDFEKRKFKIRKNQVLCNELIISASPEFFKGENYVKIWENNVIKFINKNFPTSLFISEHKDENSIHFHCLYVPLEQEIKIDNGKKYLQRKLNSRKIFNKFNLYKYHDDLAKVNKKLGLQRGRCRTVKADVEDIGDFYSDLNLFKENYYEQQNEQNFTADFEKYKENLKFNFDEISVKTQNDLLLNYIQDLEKNYNQNQALIKKLLFENFRLKNQQENLLYKSDVKKKLKNLASINFFDLFNKFGLNISPSKNKIELENKEYYIYENSVADKENNIIPVFDFLKNFLDVEDNLEFQKLLNLNNNNFLLLSNLNSSVKIENQNLKNKNLIPPPKKDVTKIDKTITNLMQKYPVLKKEYLENLFNSGSIYCDNKCNIIFKNYSLNHKKWTKGFSIFGSLMKADFKKFNCEFENEFAYLPAKINKSENEITEIFTDDLGVALQLNQNYNVKIFLMDKEIFDNSPYKNRKFISQNDLNSIKNIFDSNQPKIK